MAATQVSELFQLSPGMLWQEEAKGARTQRNRMSRVAVKEDEDEKKKEKKEDGNSINKAQNKINSQMKLNGVAKWKIC
ncbi:hypothetical protein RUM44_011940 [Polyplax serrata]|uniref:Uncharacterized protein n=1 Tax=Polyplax serrata TaxID=468196 RepID=A0ABR1BDZ3_POLSC